MENKINFSLTYWETKELLNQLETLMCVVNRDNEPVYQLYEIIASQLQGSPVKVQRPERKIDEVRETERLHKRWFEFWKGQ